MDSERRRKIVAVVQYDGTDFYGFQRQARGRTVQEALEAGLGELFPDPKGTIANRYSISSFPMYIAVGAQGSIEFIRGATRSML